MVYVYVIYLFIEQIFINFYQVQGIYFNILVWVLLLFVLVCCVVILIQGNRVLKGRVIFCFVGCGRILFLLLFFSFCNRFFYVQFCFQFYWVNWFLREGFVFSYLGIEGFKIQVDVVLKVDGIGNMFFVFFGFSIIFSQVIYIWKIIIQNFGIRVGGLDDWIFGV